MLSYANRDDATRDAAYGVSIAAAESELGMLAISRAEHRTGADYYIQAESDWTSADRVDLETAYRLEVSGVDRGSDSVIRSRVRTKVKQLQDGDSDLPGIAAVVGFSQLQVILELVEG
jgi:hypothetical protein